MFFKLAVKNVKKSFKDYMIYFLTLMFAVCMFYVFNSVDGFVDNLALSENMKKLIQSADVVMRALSILVAGVLAFLIIYANSFLMKRRKKELGLYMILGMRKRKISIILIIETFFIGLISLVVGLGIGAVLSQSLSGIIAKAIDVSVTKFEFVFSKSACIETSVFFAITFIIVMIFNSVSISKYKLIELLRSGKKNEKMVEQKTWCSVLMFIVSVICYIYTYSFFFNIGTDNNTFDIFNDSTKSTYLAFASFAIGTFLFFISIACIILKLFQESKKIYYKGLNIFTIRQISSKINSTRIAMAFISLMLFIGVFAMTFCNSMSSLLKQDVNCNFDLTIMRYNQFNDNSIAEQSLTDIVKKELNVEESFAHYEEYKIYTNINKYGENILSTNINGLKNFDIMAISDYNSAMKFASKDTINLSKDQYAIVVEEPSEKDLEGDLKNLVKNDIEEFLKNNTSISTKSTELTPYNNEVIYNQFGNFTGGNILILVPDDVVETAIIGARVFNANYNVDKETIEKNVTNTLIDDNNTGYSMYNEKYSMYIYSKIGITEQLIGSQLILVCTGLYLGVIFMLASAAILALQQLSEASDNSLRYNLLKRLGTKKSMIRGSVFKQVSVYFLIPLAFSVINVGIALLVANNLVKNNMGTNVPTESLVLTGLVIFAIYGLYYLITFSGCNRLANQSKYCPE